MPPPMYMGFSVDLSDCIGHPIARRRRGATAPIAAREERHEQPAQGAACPGGLSSWLCDPGACRRVRVRNRLVRRRVLRRDTSLHAPIRQRDRNGATRALPTPFSGAVPIVRALVGERSTIRPCTYAIRSPFRTAARSCLRTAQKSIVSRVPPSHASARW
jgi:hypothetical protein